MKTSLDTENHEAERAVIAALVRNPDGRVIIRLGISTDLFDHPSCREAFVAIAAFVADGIQPDAATLRSAVSNAVLIEIETSLRDNISSANLPVYVKLLKDCRRERQIQAARSRLVQAAHAGAPEHELSAIVESIHLAGQEGETKSRFVDVIALCALPPLESWLVKGYLSTDSLSVLFGDPGCGKSFLSIDIACHVATGRPWNGRPVQPGKVLYIAGEGRNGLSRRFKAWFEHHGETLRNIQLCLVPISLTDPANIAALIADIQALQDPPVLIVIDTINRNFGPGDENSTADMTKAVAGLDAIRISTGAAMLGVHHSGHAEKGRGRGSSVLRAAVDTEYSIEKLDTTVQMRCTKAKDFDYPLPLMWKLERRELPWADDDGVPLDSAVLVSGDFNGPISVQRRMTPACRIALDALKTALETQGVEIDGIRMVAEDDWRQAAYAAGIAADDATQQAKRRAFLRSREILVSDKIVQNQDGFCHLSEGGTKRYKAVQVPSCTPVQGGTKRYTPPLGGVPDVPLPCTAGLSGGLKDENVPHRQSEGRSPDICSWDRCGDRLLTKCADPAPNEDRTGCANCWASKP